MICGCPQGYTFNEASGLCEDIVNVPAILNSQSRLPRYCCGSVDNMLLGTAIYPEITEDQFPLIAINSSGPAFIDVDSTVLNPETYLSSGDLWASEGKIYKGRLNQAGISLYPTNEWQGYAKCLVFNSEDTYFLAISSTFAFRVLIDGILAIQYSKDIILSPNAYLHIFPLNLVPGKHCLLFEGFSSSAQGCESGSFVCEIYKNVTPQILNTLHNQEQLNAYYASININGIGQLITTLYLAGSPTDTGENGSYFCETGFLNTCIEGQTTCQYKLSVAPTPCCFVLTNCVTGTTLITSSNLTYINNIIKINESSGCFVIAPFMGECIGIAVTVKNYYLNCTECLKVYYKLTDCTGEATSLFTTQNLSLYVGKIIKVSNYEVCWIVTIDQSTTNLTSVEILQSFNTCEDCL